MNTSHLLAALAALVLVQAACADTGAIIGLIGRSANQTRAAGRELEQTLAAGTPPWSELRGTCTRVLEQNLAAGRGLRTAFALGHVGTGYQPGAPVAGLSPAQVRSLDPNAFYHSAVYAHLELNDRLRQVLEDRAGEMEPGETSAWRAALDRASEMVPHARERDGSP